MSEIKVRPDGLKIRAARKAKDWTQEQLALRTGYAVSVIQKVETGKYFGMPCLEACVEALGEAYERLLLGEKHHGLNVVSKPHDNDQSVNEDAAPVHDVEDSDATDSPTESALEDCDVEMFQSPAGPAEGGVIVQTGTAPIELVINRDFDSYSLREQERLLSAIKELLGVSEDIRVIRKRPGSVKLTLALSPDQAEKLIWAVKAGDLAEFGVVDAKLGSAEGPSAQDTMGLEQLADYLQRDVREVTKMANRGYLPGQKVGGQWRFARVEINHWIDTQMHAYTEEQLTALEAGRDPSDDKEPLIGALLSVASVAVPLTASTRSSVLRELVRLAEQSWHVYDPAAVIETIQQREEMGSTALACGVAIPHPRRAQPAALGQSVIAYGRTASGIPFGAPDGGLTDLFFLVCCRDDLTQVRVLARLTRMLLRPGFLVALRQAESVAETWQVIQSAEHELDT